MGGRRRQSRHSIQLGARVLVGAGRTERVGQLKDISAGGALVIVDDPISFGDVVRLRFYVQANRCEASGRVLRTMSFDGRRGIAIEFAHANTALLEFIRDLDIDHEARIGEVRDLTIEIAIVQR